jgi:hypothetical protein
MRNMSKLKSKLQWAGLNGITDNVINWFRSAVLKLGVATLLRVAKGPLSGQFTFVSLKFVAV